MASDVEKLARELLAAAVGDQMTAEDFIRNDGAICFVDEALAAISAALTQPAASGEVVRQFQDREGNWHCFHDKKHEDNTIASGEWPIRALYASPQPDADTVRDAARAEAIRRCAISYLGMLGVKNPEQALDEDIRDPDMCGDAAIDSAIKGEK